MSNVVVTDIPARLDRLPWSGSIRWWSRLAAERKPLEQVVRPLASAD